MRTKPAAIVFLYLFCFQYVLGVLAVTANPYAGAKSRIRRQSGCRLSPQLEVKLNDCFDRIRSGIQDSEELPTQSIEEYELSQGMATGLSNFVKGPFRCSCGRNQVRIFVRVDFLRILLTFVLNLVDDLLGGLLGNLGSGLAGLLGNVINLVVRILVLRIPVQVTILQRFVPGTTCVVESFEVTRVISIQLLGLDLAPLVQILSPLLTPIVSALLRAILNERVKVVFQREIQRITILQTEVGC